MLFKSLSGFFARKSSRRPFRKNTVHLGVETLEDRAVPANFTVTNTLDAGLGSLRQAIDDANQNFGGTIDFDIPGSVQPTIHLKSPLPFITSNWVTIDGSTQTPYLDVPAVELDGSALEYGDGLTFYGNRGTVHGMAINNFKHGAGIMVFSSKCTVSECYIGTDLGGFHAAPNAVGIELRGTLGGAFDNFIGQTWPFDHRNVISGNINAGIAIDGYLHGAEHNTIESCIIGMNAEGTGALPNGSGIVLINGASHNTIGGENPGDPGVGVVGTTNFISGNIYSGVQIVGSEHTPYPINAAHNVIEGNLIGVDIYGKQAVPNGLYGVDILQGAEHNLVGGDSFAACNIISGNGDSGVVLRGGGTSHNAIAGNFIGLDIGGKVALPNKLDGVLISSGASANTVGGVHHLDRNVISGNGRDGIDIDGTAVFYSEDLVEFGASNNTVANNFIGVDHNGVKAVPNGLDGIEIQGGATGNVIGVPASSSSWHNVISGNKDWQVSIHGTGTANNVLQRNYIGLDAKGQHAVVSSANSDGRRAGGVEMADGATFNEIGGAVVGTGNVIAGNSVGVSIHGIGTFLNNVDGNYIGLEHTGKHAVPNLVGVTIADGASRNSIGQYRRNVISGNISDGVLIGGPQTYANLVQNNFIGTNRTGNAKVGNGAGVAIINGAHDNVVAGDAGSHNVISGNLVFGVVIQGRGTNGNVVQDNLIGTDSTGKKSMGNGRHGVFVTDGASSNYFSDNTIAHNGMDGVLIGSDPGHGFNTPAGNRNTVSQNSIFSNGKIGIDLGPNDGPTPNSPNYLSGPNDLLNHPVLTLVARHPNGVVTVTGEYYTQITQTITVEVFANSPGALPQGQVFLGSFQFQATGNSISPFIHNLTGIAALAPPGTKITTTATDALGNTSEFSAPFTVVADPVKPLAGLVRENAALIGLLPQDSRLIVLLQQESELIGLMQGQESELIGLSGQSTDRSGSLVRQLELIGLLQQERSELIGLLGDESALIGLLPSDSALIGLFRSQESDLIGLLGTA